MTGFTIIEPGLLEWRSATVDEDGFAETIQFHTDADLSPLDAIFRARVTRVDGTLDMAFLDLGDGLAGAMNLRRAKLLVKGRADSISDCVREGDMLTVQVLAEPSALEGKALPVTPRPRLLGRYVVVEAGGARLNFSKDLGPKAQKALAPLLTDMASNAALIVRSHAGSVPPAAVAAEAGMLMNALWGMADKPGMLFAHSPMAQALLAAPHDDGEILIEGGSALADAKAMAARYWPDVADRLKPYKGKTAAFEEYGVNEAVEEALSDRIDLPSGGWISITPTPALTAVDVNMGGALKGRNAGEAKLITNMEAAMAVAWHLRFQDIGGLVVVDFIDMSSKGHARELMNTVDAAFKNDTVPVQHTGLSQFGLMEINRKRSGLSLRDRMIVRAAPSARAQAQALQLLRDGVRAANRAEPGALVIAAPEGTKRWLEARTDVTDSLREATGRDVVIEGAAEPAVWLRA
ncbi:ribonuclease E/G [Kordiimonas lipolytica]|uniref:Ribonuclease E/G n=1 Tax=Kordiimonas lipolytica TaxID=1662421 RepID=A0ABV8U6I6_9PROT|nr:ribonuclease E/G [Kordiimonas lipolytica]